MIDYKFLRETDLLLEYAAVLGDTAIQDILARGRIDSADDARALVKFYWRMVDASTDDDIDAWLERILTTLSIASGNASFSDVWDKEVAEA